MLTINSPTGIKKAIKREVIKITFDDLEVAHGDCLREVKKLKAEIEDLDKNLTLIEEENETLRKRNKTQAETIRKRRKLVTDAVALGEKTVNIMCGECGNEDVPLYKGDHDGRKYYACEECGFLCYVSLPFFLNN